MILLKQTKKGDDRVVPMTPEVYKLMAACVSGKAKDDFVFTHKDGKQVKDFRGRWDRLLKDGVSEKFVHDSRRSAIRNMERAGIPQSAAMKVSEHRTNLSIGVTPLREADWLEAANKIESAKRVWARKRAEFPQKRPEQGSHKSLRSCGNHGELSNLPLDAKVAELADAPDLGSNTGDWCGLVDSKAIRCKSNHFSVFTSS